MTTDRLDTWLGAQVAGTPAETIYSVPLGRCDVDWHADRGIVVVACVGRDIIRVWPLPVEQAWWEDAIETPDGELACRAQEEL